MIFLVDVHLPISLSKFLNNQPNCNALHVNQILQKWNTNDADICKYADENDLVVITKDSDFKNSHFINKTPLKSNQDHFGEYINQHLILLFSRYLPFITSLSDKKSFYIEIDKDQLIGID